MIRRVLERGYNATIGGLRKALGRGFGSLSSRMGILQLLYIIALVALMGGFANAVFFPLPNQGQIVYPGTGSQTIPEAVLDTLVILVGGAGIYVAYASGRQTTRSRMVNLYLGIALLLIALSFFMGNYLSNLKG